MLSALGAGLAAVTWAQMGGLPRDAVGTRIGIVALIWIASLIAFWSGRLGAK